MNFFSQSQQQNKKSKILAKAENWTRGLLHSSLECYLSATNTTEHVNIKVKLLNCFTIKGQNINKQSQICRTHFFCNMFTFMDNYWQFLMFMG